MTIPFTLNLNGLNCPHCGKDCNIDYSMYDIITFSKSKNIELKDRVVTCWNCKQFFAVEAHLKPSVTVSALNKVKP